MIIISAQPYRHYFKEGLKREMQKKEERKKQQNRSVLIA
jgi:hypothetical protein